MVILKVKHVL